MKPGLRRTVWFWWTTTCLRYGHFAHRRRFGALSCVRWQVGHWLGCHTRLGRYMAGRRLDRMERKWAASRIEAEEKASP